MAINIFQGGKNSGANKASRSERVKAVTNTLDGAAEVSNSGNTAVKTQNTLSKVGGIINKVSGIAAKFLPGIGGTVAKVVNNLTGNDPEWWQSIPGDPVTLNNPLRLLEVDAGVSVAVDGHSSNRSKAYYPRAAFAEFVSEPAEGSGGLVFRPTTQMITQYLMPEIRKVVNAIPLQAADDYKFVIQIQAAAYAMWRNLRKYDYILKHGMAYMPNLDDPEFPVFQVENAAWLQSTINRLEEYLRSNVRLPHTLCEYLAWRFGRLYRANSSKKAGLIMYNVLPLNTPIAEYNRYISSLMSAISSNESRQKANTDMFNTYYDHDMIVEIRDDTQCAWDYKEFMLRTNSDVRPLSSEGVSLGADTPDIVFIDSEMDNPTVFMASTVSTATEDAAGERSLLFPVRDLGIYLAGVSVETPGSTSIVIQGPTAASSYTVVNPVQGSLWMRESVLAYNGDHVFTNDSLEPSVLARMHWIAALCKSLDIYNKNVYVPIAMKTAAGSLVEFQFLDITQISYESGMVPPLTLATEHVYAFGNLVDIARKHSMSYAKAEKVVAKETANLIDTLDVASVPPVTTSK